MSDRGSNTDILKKTGKFLSSVFNLSSGDAKKALSNVFNFFADTLDLAASLVARANRSILMQVGKKAAKSTWELMNPLPKSKNEKMISQEQLHELLNQDQSAKPKPPL